MNEINKEENTILDSSKSDETISEESQPIEDTCQTCTEEIKDSPLTEVENNIKSESDGSDDNATSTSEYVLSDAEQSNVSKTKKRHTVAIITLVISILAIIGILFVVVFSLTRPYKSPIYKYVKASSTKNVSDYKGCVETTQLKDMTDDDITSLLSNIDSNLKTYVGDNYTVKAQFLDSTKASDDELKEIKSEVSDDIKDCQQVCVKLEFKGDKKTITYYDTILVVKSGKKWKILPSRDVLSSLAYAYNNTATPDVPDSSEIE